MKTYLRLACLGLAAMMTIGCVSQTDFDRTRTALLKEKEQNAELQVRLEAAQSEIRALREARSGAVSDSDLQVRLEAALTDKDRMTQRLAELEQRLRNMGASEIVLPGPVDSALRDLAAANPELLTYDPRRGMVRIASDLTFALGSVAVNPNAQSVLRRIAGIINMPEAQRYEALIVGHTDNVRIARAETRAMHPTNWHLSVHRSISVKDVLAGTGVAQGRVCVAGYGEFRPVVSNGPRGAQANRRVELFLVPSTAGSIEPGPAVDAPAASAPAASPVAPAAPAPAAENPAMFK